MSMCRPQTEQTMLTIGEDTERVAKNVSKIPRTDITDDDKATETSKMDVLVFDATRNCTHYANARLTDPQNTDSSDEELSTALRRSRSRRAHFLNSRDSFRQRVHRRSTHIHPFTSPSTWSLLHQWQRLHISPPMALIHQAPAFSQSNSVCLSKATYFFTTNWEASPSIGKFFPQNEHITSRPSSSPSRRSSSRAAAPRPSFSRCRRANFFISRCRLLGRRRFELTCGAIPAARAFWLSRWRFEGRLRLGIGCSIPEATDQRLAAKGYGP